jgi:hypothetical protein
MNLKGLLAATALGLTMLAGTADASILFDIDAANSWVSVTTGPHIGSGVKAELVSGLGATTFSLDEGYSHSFDFLKLGGQGFGGAGTYYISAQLAFSQPLGTPAAVGHGGGVYAHFLGVLNAGTLSWSDMPDVITLADGSIIEVDFQDGWTIQHGKPIVGATVRLVEEASAVPEPGTLALLGAGMAGLGFATRRRAQPADELA